MSTCSQCPARPRKDRMIFVAQDAQRRDVGPPGGRIPDTCSRCGHTVTLWKRDHGHMVQVRCDDPKLAQLRDMVS